MRILRNKEGDIIIIKGDLEKKLLEILDKAGGPVKFTELVMKVYGEYDDSKRISLLRVVNRLNDKGIVVKLKVGGDLYIKPEYKDVRVLYYTSILIPYFAVLNIISSTMALLYKNPYAAYGTLYYILASSVLLYIIYAIERWVLGKK